MLTPYQLGRMVADNPELVNQAYDKKADIFLPWRLCGGGLVGQAERLLSDDKMYSAIGTNFACGFFDVLEEQE